MIKLGDCAFQDGSYPCGYHGDKLPDCELCHKLNPTPRLGEIKLAVEVGRKSHCKYIRSICIDCGIERWVQLVRGKPESLRCKGCVRRGALNPKWRGGKTTDGYGYNLIKLQPNDFFYSMTDHQGYIREHRLVVAKALGRCLHRWEIVHHKKGFAKDDNRYPETLQLVGNDRHDQITILGNRIKCLEQQVLNEHKAGIREVVEWIEEHGTAEANYTSDLHMARCWIELPRTLWQAKLKEWKINDKDNIR